MEKEKRFYALIMAGGQGTRFWPWSTSEKPKQFLSIIGKEPLITQTYNRLKELILEENIFIVADKKYLTAVQETIPGFREENYIAEPSPKNTAPCLMLSNIVLSRKNSDANVMVVPADHYIPDVDVFAAQFFDALKCAETKCIVTSGIKPTMPHTGYGYINFDEKESARTGDTQFFDVVEFKEKPERRIAEEYMEAGNYYWNSGMFIYKLKHFKELLGKYSPYYYQKYLELENSFTEKGKFVETFNGIEPESIDYALMEKVKEVKIFKARFNWSDVGAWSSVYELSPKDENDNAAAGKNSIFIDSKNSLIFSTEEKPVAVIGLKDVTVINTGNGILVADINELQEVKRVIKNLAEKHKGSGLLI